MPILDRKRETRKRVVAARKIATYTQGEVARYMSMTTREYQKVEALTKPLNEYQLRNLADTLKVSMEYLTLYGDYLLGSDEWRKEFRR
jgi:hypothetical protein